MKEAIKQDVLKIQKGIQKGRNAKKEAENTKKELLEKRKMQEETKENAKNLKKEFADKTGGKKWDLKRQKGIVSSSESTERREK